MQSKNTNPDRKKKHFGMVKSWEKQMRRIRNMFVSVLMFAPLLAAQLHIGGLIADPGAPIDFSASVGTTPTGVGTSLPATCAVGQQFFKSNNSAGTELYLCAAANTWTQLTGGGGGGVLDPGTNGVMKRTALNTTAAATATDVSSLSYVAGGGTAQAQSATLATAITSLTTGLDVCWLPAAANTGAAPTLAINGLTPKPLTKYGNAALVANDLTTTAIACAMYDGTEFQLQNPQTFPVFVKINGGAAVGPQTTLNLIPGTGLAGFTGIVNGSQFDITLPIDTAYLNTNYARLSAANTYSGGGLQDMHAADLRLPVHSSDPGTCTAGQIEFNSTGPSFKGCATTNTWSAFGGGGSVTSIATTSPITGGTITTAGTIACATCVVSSSPGVGIAHFAGSTQTVTSSAVNLPADVTGTLPVANGGTGLATAESHAFSFQVAKCNNATAVSSFDLPTANAPTPTCHGTTYTWGTLDYAHTAATKASFSFRLPIGWTANVDVGLDWFTSATTNTNKWTIETACLVEGTTDATAPPFNAAQTITTTSNGTTNVLTRSSQSAITTTGCAAGNIMILRIGRDVSDTNTSTDSLQNVDVTLRTTPQA
jgi:hypothetical protein